MDWNNTDVSPRASWYQTAWREDIEGILSLQCFWGISYTSQSACLAVRGDESVSGSPFLLSFHGDVTGIVEHQGAERRDHSLGWNGTMERYICQVCTCVHAHAQVHFLSVLAIYNNSVDLPSFNVMQISANYKTYLRDYQIIHPTDYFSSTSICLFISFPSSYHAFHAFPQSFHGIRVRLLCAPVSWGVSAGGLQVEAHCTALTQPSVQIIMRASASQDYLQGNPSGSSLPCSPSIPTSALFHLQHCRSSDTLQSHSANHVSTDVSIASSPA